MNYEEIRLERMMKEEPYQGPPAPVRPMNCRKVCPYGKDRNFCFPCMNKILAERRAAAGC